MKIQVDRVAPIYQMKQFSLKSAFKILVILSAQIPTSGTNKKYAIILIPTACFLNKLKKKIRTMSEAYLLKVVLLVAELK